MKVIQYIMKFIIFILLGIFWVCDTPTLPIENPGPQINNVIFEYDQIDNSVWLQVDVSDPQGVENIDSVWVELEPLSGAEVLYHFLLNDEGVNGDIIPNNSIFTLHFELPDGIPYSVYRIKSYALDIDQNLAEKPGVVNIEEQIPPAIESVMMPEVFYLDPTEWGTLSIQVQIYDPNGADDISYVRYAINTDFLTIDCEGNMNSNPDADNYYWDPTWSMDYLNTDVDGIHTYQTSIPMRPVDDGMGNCGKTGLAFFQFSVSDRSGGYDFETEIPLEIIKCGDTFCQSAFEDSLSCPEDCQ